MGVLDIRMRSASLGNIQPRSAGLPDFNVAQMASTKRGALRDLEVGASRIGRGVDRILGVISEERKAAEERKIDKAVAERQRGLVAFDEGLPSGQSSGGMVFDAMMGSGPNKYGVGPTGGARNQIIDENGEEAWKDNCVRFRDDFDQRLKKDLDLSDDQMDKVKRRMIGFDLTMQNAWNDRAEKVGAARQIGVATANMSASNAAAASRYASNLTWADWQTNCDRLIEANERKEGRRLSPEERQGIRRSQALVVWKSMQENQLEEIAARADEASGRGEDGAKVFDEYKTKVAGSGKDDAEGVASFLPASTWLNDPTTDKGFNIMADALKGVDLKEMKADFAERVNDARKRWEDRQESIRVGNMKTAMHAFEEEIAGKRMAQLDPVTAGNVTFNISEFRTRINQNPHLDANAKGRLMEEYRACQDYQKKYLEDYEKYLSFTAAKPLAAEIAGKQMDVLDPATAKDTKFDVTAFRKKLDAQKDITPERKAALLDDYVRAHEHQQAIVSADAKDKAALEQARSRYGYIDENGVFIPASSFAKMNHPTAVYEFDPSNEAFWADTAKANAKIEAARMNGMLTEDFYKTCRKTLRAKSDEAGRKELEALLPYYRHLLPIESGYGSQPTKEQSKHRRRYGIPSDIGFYAKTRSDRGTPFRSGEEFVKDMTSPDKPTYSPTVENGRLGAVQNPNTEAFIDWATWNKCLDAAFQMRGMGVKSINEALQLIVAPSLKEGYTRTLEERISRDGIDAIVNQYRRESGYYDTVGADGKRTTGTLTSAQTYYAGVTGKNTPKDKEQK